MIQTKFQTALVFQRVALAIVKEGKRETFQDMAPEQALEWLQSTNSASAGASFANFLELHGHRCIKEVRATSWDFPSPEVTSLGGGLALNDAAYSSVSISHV